MSARDFLCSTVFLSACLVGGCGGGNIGDVCSALASQTAQVCDQSDPADVTDIQAVYASLGESVTESQIMAGSVSNIASDCEAALSEGEVELTDEDAALIIAALEFEQTCSSLASTVITIASQF